MPDRDTASFCRPRLYDKNDPEVEDDVSLVLDGIDEILEDAMNENNEAKLTHATGLKKRIIQYAGQDYEDRMPRHGEAEA